MRPTYLQFRSPKERTGEFLYPGVTCDGKSMKYQGKQYTKTTFPQGKRWEHIRQVACRTSFKVGPGCYNTPLTTNKGRAARIEKDVATLSSGFDYVYVGESLVRKDRGSTPRTSYYQTDRTVSPTNSRYGRLDTNESVKASKRPVSVGRMRASYDSFDRGDNYSPTNYGARRTTAESPKKRTSFDVAQDRDIIPNMRRIYPAHESYDHQVRINDGYSPTYKSKIPVENPSPKRSLKNSKHWKSTDVLKVKEKDFYAALQEQWGHNQKIVIQN